MEKPHITDKVVYRSLDLSAGQAPVIDVEARTATLTFASDYPVERFDWLEVLDMSGMSTERIGSGRAALLVEHIRTDQVGVIQGIALTDGVWRATVKFSRSARGEEIFQDVIDGIRTLVSVGYVIDEYVLDSDANGVRTYRAVRWTPHEISIVSIPADPTVGVGRSMPEAPAHPPGPEQASPVQLRSLPNPQKKDNIVDEIEKAVAAANQRAADILSLGATHKADKLAREFVASGKTVDEFRAALLDQSRKPEPIEAPAIAGLSKKEARQFSVARALDAMVSGKRSLAAFEFEASDAALKASGRSVKAGGIIIPADVQLARASQHTVGNPANGGYLTTEELRYSDFISALRTRLVSALLGVRVISDINVAKLLFPKSAGVMNGAWLGEDGAAPNTGAKFKQVPLTMSTYAAKTGISRSLMLQSGNFGIEAFINDELFQAVRYALDHAVFVGGGPNEPPGVLEQLTEDQMVMCGAGYTWADIVAQETMVADANADVGVQGYLASAKARGALKTTEKSAGTAQYLWTDVSPGVGMVNGYNAQVSNVLRGSMCELLHGNFADVILGLWSPPEIVTDSITDDSGAHIVKIFQDAGVAIRNLESFSAAVLEPQQP